jgi:hypothetical protein
VASNPIMLPASVLIEGIGNITLTVGKPGAWISKNWVSNYWWMVATLPANKIWHFRIQDTRISSRCFILSSCSGGFCVFIIRRATLYMAKTTSALAGRAVSPLR